MKAIVTAGTLDILSAIVLTILAGNPVDRMLAGIASGPFGDRVLALGLTASILGLATHYVLMAVMVLVFAWLVWRYPDLSRRSVAAGILYGLAIYVVMYWLVLPARWPDSAQIVSIRTVAIPMLIHAVLVGLPISLIVSGTSRRSSRLSAELVSAKGRA